MLRIIATMILTLSINGFTFHTRPRSYSSIPSALPQSAFQTRIFQSQSETEIDLPKWKSDSAFRKVLMSAKNATTQRSADTSNMGHDPFRYEWGTWVVEESIQYLMAQMDTVRLNAGMFDELLEKYGDHSKDDKDEALRIRVAGGHDWDCLLHILPTDCEWSGRWPTGSWAVVKCLTGVTEISALRGPNRDGLYVKKTSKDLRGGSDGSFGSGSASAGVDCIKYVGGPLRRYSGKSGKTTLLEIVLRPPIGKLNDEQDISHLPVLQNVDSVFSIKIPLDESSSKSEDDSSTPQEPKPKPNTTPKQNILATTLTTNVGGLNHQLESIARRVLASRSNPEATKRLGVSHVRGILLSGPPGCGKTLLARELAHLLGAREPQIVNGPEILDKFIGEAEKKVRDLFLPAELEYKECGDESALHMIILDEMDAIARKRGSMTSDTTGVRDSVVNQLLAKMDGVKEASNVLVVGLTNRPELLDPALLRPGRLEVQLRVELPDLHGRRDILQIHTRQMRKQNALSQQAMDLLLDVGSELGIPVRTEYFSGAELAGLIRSAASFALARTMEDLNDAGTVGVSDLEQALLEVRPALGKQDDVLQMRFPLGISTCNSNAMKRILRDLDRFIAPLVHSKAPRLQSMLLVGAGNQGGAGATALACHAASNASSQNTADYVRVITALDILNSEGGGGEEARAAALVDQFSEAKEMAHSLLVLEDVDQLCAGSGQYGYSSIMVATLRALLRSPPITSHPNDSKSKKSNDEFSNVPNAQSSSNANKYGKSLSILASTSRSDAACIILHELFDETIVIPLLSTPASIEQLIQDSLPHLDIPSNQIPILGQMMMDRLKEVGVKSALRLLERAVATANADLLWNREDPNADTDADINEKKGNDIQVVQALQEILADLDGDEVSAGQLCEVINI